MPLNFSISWKLLSILLKDLSTFFEITLCKNEAKEYKELSNDEIIILNGISSLCIFDNAYALGKISLANFL